MNHTLKMVLAGALVLPMAGCAAGANSASVAEGSDTLTGTYDMTITGYDWGCGTDSIVMNLDHPLDSVSADSFTVTEDKQSTDWTDPNFAITEVQVPRTVTDAYLVDEKGEKTTDPSTHVKLELYVSPNDGSPLLFSMTTQYNTWSDPYTITIEQAEGAKLTSAGTEVKTLTVDPKAANTTTTIDAWKADNEFTSEDGVTYKYATYEPEEASKTLVVWLHGMGEGGTEATDPRVTLLANKAGTLADADFQEAVGGANVLVAQCPTFWMDADGKGGNFAGGGIQVSADSHYTESLHELIAKYKEETGSEKVVLAGCSNGGYMTMVMAINYGEEYDAYVPICEALEDKLITDDQIKDLAKLNMYFVYSEDDTTVDPTNNEVPTIKRLKKAGAEKLHVSTTEHVVDLSGTYFADENGQPVTEDTGAAYQYMGHWSWIYFFNNQCDADGLSAWDFIADAVK